MMTFLLNRDTAGKNGISGKKNLDLKGKKILDVGGNTGFFSFDCLDAGASELVYVGGNENTCKICERGL